MKIKAKDAVPGQWYEHEGERLICVGRDSDCDLIFAEPDERYILDPGDEITHLEGCTGWDWEPEKPATPDPGEGWRIASGDDWKDKRCEIWFDNQWVKRSAGNIGRFPLDKGSVYRVPIDPEPKHPPIPEGWGDLRLDRRVFLGEQYCVPRWSFWIPCGTAYLDEAESFTFPDPMYVIRRTPRFRPFANAEEFKPHRDRWWRFKTDAPHISYPPQKCSDLGHASSSWKSSHDEKVFDDGTPFGVEVKEWTT